VFNFSTSNFMSAEINPKLTLQTIRQYNCTPGRRLTDGHLGSFGNTAISQQFADGLYDKIIVDGAVGMSARINAILSAAQCNLRIDVGATTQSTEWLETQRPYVRNMVVKLGYVSSRLAECDVLLREQVEALAVYRRVAVESLCMAALLGMGERKLDAANVTLLHRPIESVVFEAARFPNITAASWRTILAVGNSGGVRAELIERHINSGRSVYWCYSEMRRGTNNAWTAHQAEIAQARIPTQRRNQNKSYSTWYNNPNG
jgi:hypothetical protein